MTIRRAFQAKSNFRNFSATVPAAAAVKHDAHAAPAHDAHGHDNHGHGDSHAHDSHGHGHDDHGHDDHAHHGPHVPEGYDKIGTFCLLTAYLWVLYKFKKDNGQLFGYYQPWLHEHEHEHFHFTTDESGKVVLVEEEEEEVVHLHPGLV